MLEGVTIAHNASAVMRTCDAAGVLHLDLIGPNPELLQLNKAISTRADKWLEIAVHPTPADCLKPLEGGRLSRSWPRISSKDAVPYTDDRSRPAGRPRLRQRGRGHHRGMLCAFADKVVRIPMFGHGPEPQPVGLGRGHALRGPAAAGGQGLPRTRPSSRPRSSSGSRKSG
ncbi:MAG: hypothetical protein M0C28_21055 [Candidatus Moduliflexus flocculans]|nr:hypothetical protein [Candidatus Moduliflexus flocculans]